MQTAFFLTDEFKGNISSASTYDSAPNTNNFVKNISNPRPRVAWVAGKAAPSAPETVFVVDASNRYIDVRADPVGDSTLTLTPGSYNGTTLASEITTQFAASTHAASWIADYNVANGLFQFYDGAGSPTNLKILWKTGNHGTDNANDSMVKELGWVDPEGSATDTTQETSHTAPYSRWNTHTYAFIKLPQAKELRAWLCEVANQELGYQDTTIDVSNIKIYGADANLGTLYNWQSSAPDSLTFSAGPYFSENQIRLAHKASGASSDKLCWLFSWRHQDQHKTHSVKLCKAFERVWSATGRTLTTLKRQGMLNTGQPLGVDNYYPVQRLRRWVAPLAFDAWPAAEYRTVVQGVVHHGRQDGLLWALRWDDIVAGTVDAQDEADKGFLIWGALHDYSLDTYVGESADYISGEITIEQIR